MTPEERKYAENNINIVYDYLHKNRLDIDEWFDIVVFGYLRAVMDYYRKKELKQYAFTTIAWSHMRSEASNYRVHNQALKRTCEIVSFDTARTESGAGLDEVISSTLAENQYQEIEFSHDMQQVILKKLNKEQRQQLYLLYCEYKPGEITNLLGISKERQRKNKAYMQLIFSKSSIFSPYQYSSNTKKLLVRTGQEQ